MVTNKPSVCVLGSIYWGGYDKNTFFSFKLNEKYDIIVNEFLSQISNKQLSLASKFGVVHWRRGDQLTSRCLLTHIDRENVFDFSVNCESVYEFIKVIKIIQKSYQYPLFIATNDKVRESIEAIEYAGFKIINSELKKRSQMNLTSADLFMVELSMMFHADTIWGSGQSTMHEFLGELRSNNRRSDWTSIPGINNQIFSYGEHTTGAVCQMFRDLNLNTTTNITSSKLDSIAVVFKPSDLEFGKLKLFLERFVNYTKSQHPKEKKEKPKLFLIPLEFLSISQKKILSSYVTTDLKNSFFSVAIRTEETYENANKMFFEVMSYLSSSLDNVNTVLLVQPSVNFTHADWYDRFVKLSLQQSFWVLGSYYKDETVGNNLNANRFNSIAMYQLGNPTFVEFLKLLRSYSLLYHKISFHRLWIFMRQSLISWFKNNEWNLKKINSMERLLTNVHVIINPMKPIDIMM